MLRRDTRRFSGYEATGDGLRQDKAFSDLEKLVKRGRFRAMVGHVIFETSRAFNIPFSSGLHDCSLLPPTMVLYLKSPGFGDSCDETILYVLIKSKNMFFTSRLVNY